MIKENLKGKKILITAGPVWVPIDKVRVMTNIFGGALGYVIASEPVKMGAEVLLLMGPGRQLFSGDEEFKVVKFKFFNEVYDLLNKEISTKKYCAVIHSSAIPDYMPIVRRHGKIRSGKDNFVLKFRPTFKIVDRMKQWDSRIFLVKFKLEVNKTKSQLINTAYKSMIASNADLIVANELDGVKRTHKAFIINNDKEVIECNSKKDIAIKLLKIISHKV